MQARKYMRRRIRLIKHPHRVYKHIVSCEKMRAECQTIRHKCRNDQKDRHPDKAELRKFVKSVHIRKEKIQKNHSDKYKPQQIGHDKVLDKRDLLIDP